MKMINRSKITFEDLGVTAELSAFLTEGGVGEWHAMLHVAAQCDAFSNQMGRLSMAWEQLMTMPEMQGAQTVFKRYFLSDAANQTSQIEDRDKCTKSFIQQPPLDGSKVSLWVYLQRGMDVQYKADKLGTTIVRHNGYEHLWTMGMTDSNGDSFIQTQQLLENYENLLGGHNATLADNCIRTWFFVHDVDNNYGGLVHARRQNFINNGLTPKTHYIASTGIGGSAPDTKALVQLGAYAMTGLVAGQQRYLYAFDHLNKTIEYNVTFERGTLVKYGDCSHAYISGTASIDSNGQVLFPGDVVKQTHRMWENVEALLKEAEMSFDDVMQVIVYLRDIADYAIVQQLFQKRFPDTPYVITLAPVCRPQWLIEMECIAISDREHKEYNDF